MTQVDTIVVGAGQAGLSLSYELTQRGITHKVLEAGRIGEAWRRRWDTFCLVTPNWSVRLPGFEYSGDDPDGFMPREEIVSHLETYARAFEAPVREGIRVTGADRAGEVFQLKTDLGETLRCRNLVAATGAFQKCHRPQVMDALPDDLPFLTLKDYRRPADLPGGRVLVIGSGQSGAQISEELADAGRDVTLACGKVAWAERRLGGRDLVWWAEQAGFYAHTLDMLPEGARLAGNPLLSGHYGGRTVNFRTLQDQGVELVGRFRGCAEDNAIFEDNLAETNGFSNDKHDYVCGLVTVAAEKLGLPVPAFDPNPELVGPARTRIPLSEFGSVLCTVGFRPDYTSWLPWAQAFDADGFPIQTDGRSEVVPGLWFLGVHFLRTRGSSILLGIAEDAAAVACGIAGR